ncbi:hypothetical protein ACVBIO_03485 [Shewanella sp. 0m-8]
MDDKDFDNFIANLSDERKDELIEILDKKIELQEQYTQLEKVLEKLNTAEQEQRRKEEQELREKYRKLVQEHAREKVDSTFIEGLTFGFESQLIERHFGGVELLKAQMEKSEDEVKLFLRKATFEEECSLAGEGLPNCIEEEAI